MSATLQWVSDVGILAPTDWPIVGSNLTVSVGSTGRADLLSGESATVAEWISCGSSWTPAYRYMVLHGTVSSLSTRDGTRVDTLVVLASPLRSTVGVLITLSLNRYTLKNGIPFTPGIPFSLTTRRESLLARILSRGCPGGREDTHRQVCLRRPCTQHLVRRSQAGKGWLGSQICCRASPSSRIYKYKLPFPRFWHNQR